MLKTDQTVQHLLMTCDFVQDIAEHSAKLFIQLRGGRAPEAQVGVGQSHQHLPNLLARLAFFFEILKLHDRA
ncbi:hypothetical protein D3C73_1648030 [compost metagenome]